MKAFKNEIYWQCDLMAIKKSNVACVQWRNISQYDSGERCGPWASCFYHFSVKGQKLI
jgi:heme A synthase